MSYLFINGIPMCLWAQHNRPNWDEMTDIEDVEYEEINEADNEND